MFGFIYITTNIVNGRRYIGQCRYNKVGWRSYLGSGTYLKRALKKYGRDMFVRETIAEAATREELTKLENHYLTEFNAAADPNWYNVSPRANSTRGFSGYSHSPERNEQVAAKLRGRKRPTHVGDAVRAARTGHTKTDEDRASHSKSLRSWWANPEVRKRMSEKHKARWAEQKTKAMQSSSE